MHWKTTTLLAVLLAGLGAFYYVYEVREGPAREKAASVKDRLWKELEAKDIDDVVVTRGADAVHLKKSGDRWALVAPVESRAEAGPVDLLTSSLATTRVEREIDPKPVKLADYGLDPPAAEVTFTAKGQAHGLRLGGKSPTGTWVYAQETGKPSVFLAPESLLQDAQKRPADFRDKTVLAFETKDVKGLEVKEPAGPAMAVALKGTDDWQLTAPLPAPADRTQVSGLLDRLRAAKVKEFVTDAPKSVTEFGLDRPRLVTLWLGEGKDRAAKTLRLGKPVPDKKAAYAQREGEPGVFLVEEELAKSIPTSPVALRDKTVFPYDRTKVERVELESPKGRVALSLEGGAWRITAPVVLKADESATSELLGKARDLRAKDFLADDTKRLAAFGLDHPQVRVSVWEKDAKEPKVLLLGPAKEKDRAYAALQGGGPVVSVDASALVDLGRSVPDLRDKSLFAAFEARDVTRVQIQRGGDTFTLDRSGDEEWQLVTPKKGKARGGRVSELVWTVRNLKWRDLVAEQGWDPGRYGLGTPAATLTLLGKDGKTLAALAVGTREATATFVRVPGQPALYGIDPKSLGDLPATTEDLLP